MKVTALRTVLVAALPLVCSSAVAAEGPLAQKKGQGGSEIQGSAGPGGSQGDNGLQHCDKPMGAMAVVEPQDYVAQSLSHYGLQSPTGLIRMMVQQSNCFIVVERGLGMQNMMQERALQESGELRQNSNMGGGQMVSADFVLTPAVVFSENNAGGVGGALGGLLGGKSGSLIGAAAGSLKFKEAQTSMLVTDSRSGVQVAAAEGSSKKADLRLSAAFFGSLADESGKKVKGGAVFNEGDTIVPKIANVKLYASPADSGKAVATLSKGDEMIFMGEEQNGFLKVESGNGSGWVKKVLVSK
jgi:curli biogenesis system outer membrane secretion channel CsgG